MAAKKPAKAQATVTLRNLAAELAESHEVPKKRAEAMLSDMVNLIAKHLSMGCRIQKKIGGRPADAASFITGTAINVDGGAPPVV